MIAATAAPTPAGSPLPWFRRATAVAVFGATLTAGIGASYAAGVVDAPWAPSQERPEHIDIPLPGTPPASETTDGPGVVESEEPTLTQSDAADQSDRPREPGQQGQRGGRSDDAPGRTGSPPPTMAPPETTPGQGTGKGRGHGPGGNPDHADPSSSGRPDNAGRPEEAGRPDKLPKPDRNIRDRKSDRL